MIALRIALFVVLVAAAALSVALAFFWLGEWALAIYVPAILVLMPFAYRQYRRLSYR